MTMKRIIPILFSLIASFNTYAEINPDHECAQRNCSIQTPTVSIISLIAHPEKYDGKMVRVRGFMRIKFEDNALYLDQDHFEHRMSENSIWLHLDEWGKQQSYCHNSYCAVQGTFRAGKPGRIGHMGLFGGQMSDIYRVYRLD